MRTMTMLILTAALVLIAAAAWAQCPNLNGYWTTNDGSMTGGRASEAWCGSGGMPIQGGVPGNTQNAMSWNGAALGALWKAWGMEIDGAGAVLISDTLDGSGTGTRTYRTNYLGGQFWLTRDNTWADGAADLEGVLTSYVVFTTITFYTGIPMGATSNISFTGDFLNCPAVNGCEVRFAIANAMKIWDTNMATPMPANYPAFLCSASAGEFFDVCCISMDIACAIDTEPTSWGDLKAQYK
ncbi:MAG: hypothetical protein AB7V45_09845 [Candidatus Krumholzibacteriia bacterium]